MVGQARPAVAGLGREAARRQRGAEEHGGGAKRLTEEWRLSVRKEMRHTWGKKRREVDDK